MENAGKAYKSPEELQLEDFVPGKDELELIFSSLIPMYSSILIKRYPEYGKNIWKKWK